VLFANTNCNFALNVFVQDADGDCSSSPALQLTCDADKPVSAPVPPTEHTLASSVAGSSSGENVQTVSFHKVTEPSVDIHQNVDTSAGSARTTRQKRKVAHDTIITSRPFKQALQEAQKTKEVKSGRKRIRIHRRRRQRLIGSQCKRTKTKKITKTSRAKSGKNKSQTISKVCDDDEDCCCLYCQESYSESELIVAPRPAGKVDHRVYIPCRYCYGYFARQSI